MNYDKPLQMDTSVKTYETPQVDITAEQFRDSYMKAFQETAKTVYAIGKKFGQVDREIEENKEFTRVDEEIANARADYIKEYENAEKMNLSDENWRASRDEALTSLRAMEFDIINNSKLNNETKNKFAQNSNSYFREKGVKNVLAFGEYTRQANITLASQRISDSYRLFSETDNQSERDSIINSINNNKAILKKYGVDETEVNSNIVENLSKSLKIATKTQIDDLFLNLDPEVAAAQANQLILDNAQKYTATIGQISGMEKINAFETMDSYYKEHKTFFGQYINSQKRKFLYNSKAKERMEHRGKSRENILRGYIKKGDSFKIAKELTGYDYFTEEMINDNYTLNEMYGMDIETFGKIDDTSVGKIIANEDIANIKSEIAINKNNGLNSIDATKEAVYGYVDSISGDNEHIKNAMLKNIAMELKINPTVLLKGRENNKYFEVQEKINKGKSFSFPGGINSGIWRTTAKKRYDDLLRVLGGSPKAKQVLDSYLYGVYAQDPILDENLLKKNPSEILRMFLDIDENYNKVVEDLTYINELGVAPVKYEYAPIKVENLEIIMENVNPEIEEETVEEIEDNGGMYVF